MSPSQYFQQNHPRSDLPGCLGFFDTGLFEHGGFDLQNPSVKSVNHHWIDSQSPPSFGQTHSIGTPKRRPGGHFEHHHDQREGRRRQGTAKNTLRKEFSGAVPRRKSRLPHSACDTPRVHEVRDKTKLSPSFSGTSTFLPGLGSDILGSCNIKLIIWPYLTYKLQATGFLIHRTRPRSPLKLKQDLDNYGSLTHFSPPRLIGCYRML